MSRKQIQIILGPTASGKSGLAVKWAQKHNGCLVCADSVQLYKGLPVLTAQPTVSERKVALHSLYESLEPCVPAFSAAAWCARVVQELKRLCEKGIRPVLVGGTGFYIKALLEGLSPIPQVPRVVIEALSEYSTADLYTQLSAQDPKMAAQLEPRDRQRVMRALAVWKATGVSWTQWRHKKPRQAQGLAQYGFEVICLNPPPDVLRQRIIVRLDQMVAQGVFQEVEYFARRYLGLIFPEQRSRPALPQHPSNLTKKDIAELLRGCGWAPSLWPPATKALGFAELLLAVCGVLTHAQALALVLQRTCQYAKRQRTWLRHQVRETASVQKIQFFDSARAALETLHS